ncbi:MAG: hypothetical protein KC466_06035 [Myxococcales bacterium]|nr:hypothetical protein [Myxococcales bacterium]
MNRPRTFTVRKPRTARIAITAAFAFVGVAGLIAPGVILCATPDGDRAVELAEPISVRAADCDDCARDRRLVRCGRHGGPSDHHGCRDTVLGAGPSLRSDTDLGRFPLPPTTAARCPDPIAPVVEPRFAPPPPSPVRDAFVAIRSVRLLI